MPHDEARAQRGLKREKAGFWFARAKRERFAQVGPSPFCVILSLYRHG